VFTRRTRIWLRRSTAPVVLAACLIAVPLGSIAAQGKNAPGISLAVRDSVGVPIAGAELTVGDGAQRTISDADGIFRLVGLVAGPTTLRVRRIGFRPGTLDVDVAPGVSQNLVLTMARLAQPMTPIVVRGTTAYSHGRLAGFYNRRAHGGGGRFFARDQIEKENLQQLTDLFRRIPGMQITQTRMARNAVRARGASRACWPLVWLDGSPLAAAEFDLDAITPGSLDAIEVYSGPATVPPEFMGTRGLGSCGVVVLWSRVGDPKPRKQKKQITATQLADLVTSLKVYTADQVDRPARQDSSDFVVPLYPDSLYNAKIGGRVVAEFVVDSTGHVESETFGIVSSTHRLFTESVRRALQDANFIPAMHQGRLVRQVVHQPFDFVTADTVTARRGRQ
jgi:TonB family protein